MKKRKSNILPKTANFSRALTGADITEFPNRWPRNFKNFDFKKSTKGIKSVNWPARLQFISKGKLANKIDKNYVIILDGAHNVSGAKALSKVLSSIDTKWQLIFGYLILERHCPFGQLKI